MILEVYGGIIKIAKTKEIVTEHINLEIPYNNVVLAVMFCCLANYILMNYSFDALSMLKHRGSKKLFRYRKSKGE